MTERRASLQTLLVGERERIFLAIVQSTYGDTKTIPFTCGRVRCRARGGPDPLRGPEGQGGGRPPGQVHLHHFQVATSSSSAWSTGADQMEALKGVTNTAEQNTTVSGPVHHQGQRQPLDRPDRLRPSHDDAGPAPILETLVKQPTERRPGGELDLRPVSERAEAALGLGGPVSDLTFKRHTSTTKSSPRATPAGP